MERLLVRGGDGGGRCDYTGRAAAVLSHRLQHWDEDTIRRSGNCVR